VRRGHLLVYEPHALVWHHHRRDDHDVCRQVYRYGVGLTAMLTKHALSEPRVLWEIACRLPAGARFVLDSDSTKNAARGDDYPISLTVAELRGMGWGPFAYLRSRHLYRRRMGRHRSQNRLQPEVA
jgi:hypothetical protein